MVTFASDGVILGMEAVLLDSPDDVLIHRAYADLLIHHSEPAQAARGRFIEAQLGLEQTHRSAEDRRKLENKGRRLLREHGRYWLGALAPYLVDGLNLPGPRDAYRYEFQRGWLNRLVCPVLDPEFVRVLASAPAARVLRELVFESVAPGGVEALAPLEHAPFLGRLHRFWLPPEANASGREMVDALVARMKPVIDLCTPWHQPSEQDR